MGPPSQDVAPSSFSFGSSRRRPRLDRRNASKNIGYDAGPYCAPSPPRASSSSAFGTASLASSLDLTSFRIGGSGDNAGDIQLLCRNLGLSGPEDFAISLADWEAHKAIRSSSTSKAPSAPPHPDRHVRESSSRCEAAEEPTLSAAAADFKLPAKKTAWDTPIEAPPQLVHLDSQETIRLDVKKLGCGGGIKGVCPPPVMLKPPPSMALPSACLVCSSWDIMLSFAPDEKGHTSASKYGHGFCKLGCGGGG